MGTEEALIRVERGRPGEAELAAVVAVLLALQAGARQTAGPAAGRPDALVARAGRLHGARQLALTRGKGSLRIPPPIETAQAVC